VRQSGAGVKLDIHKGRHLEALKDVHPLIELVQDGVGGKEGHLCSSYQPRACMKTSKQGKACTMSVGSMAAVRVMATRFQGRIFKDRNPSMTNCPAYVPACMQSARAMLQPSSALPVMVDDWPAAKRPIAQMYLKAGPKCSARYLPYSAAYEGVG